jgi:hypothetical protein
LIKQLISRSAINDKSDKIKSDIADMRLKISDNNMEIERTMSQIGSIKSSLYSVSKITDILMGINDSICYMPENIANEINSNNFDNFITHLDSIVKDIENIDEYVSLVAKKKSIEESIYGFENMSKLLALESANTAEMQKNIDMKNNLSKERDAISTQIETVKKEKAELEMIYASLDTILKQKEELDLEGIAIAAEKKALLDENTRLYNKRVLEHCVSTFKNHELLLCKTVLGLKSDIEKCNAAITSRETLVERKNHIEQISRVYDIAYRVWNPKTGYPSMLIKDFLDEVIMVANNNLDDIWGGMLHISDYELNDSEFRLPVQRGNTPLNDVAECSKSEKSTIAMAISFAIIEVSNANKYNIIRIDEADGGYDEIRKQSYIETVSSKMQQIGCENAFIVTLNQMFDSVPCDVILIKNYDTITSTSSLLNKNIIYRYESDV